MISILILLSSFYSWAEGPDQIWSEDFAPPQVVSFNEREKKLLPGRVEFRVMLRTSEKQDCGYMHKVVELKECTQSRITLVSDYRGEKAVHSEKPDPFFFDCSTQINGRDVIAKVGTWIVLGQFEGKINKTTFTNLKVTWKGNENPWYSLGGATLFGEEIHTKSVKAWAPPSTSIPVAGSDQPEFRRKSCTDRPAREYLSVTAVHEDPNRYE